MSFLKAKAADEYVKVLAKERNDEWLHHFLKLSRSVNDQLCSKFRVLDAQREGVKQEASVFAVEFGSQKVAKFLFQLYFHFQLIIINE